MNKYTTSDFTTIHNPGRWFVSDNLLRTDKREYDWPVRKHHLVILPHIKTPGEVFRLAQKMKNSIIHYYTNTMSDCVYDPCMNIVVTTKGASPFSWGLYPMSWWLRQYLPDMITSKMISMLAMHHLEVKNVVLGHGMKWTEVRYLRKPPI